MESLGFEFIHKHKGAIMSIKIQGCIFCKIDPAKGGGEVKKNKMNLVQNIHPCKNSKSKVHVPKTDWVLFLTIVVTKHSLIKEKLRH